MIPIILIGAAYLIGKTMKDESYAKGGSINLFAPNGKPSKLTPEQWHLVRTPAFKKWFGDWEKDAGNASKVVDANGEPAVLFTGQKHGDYPKGKYVYEEDNNGIFFSFDKRIANSYGVVKSAFINARNLKDIRNHVGYDGKKISLEKRNLTMFSMKYSYKKLYEYINSDPNVVKFYEDVVEKYGGKGLKIYDEREKHILKNKEQVKNFIIPTSKEGFKYVNFRYKSSIWKWIAEYIKSSDYDGLLYTDEDRFAEDKADAILVYNSNQVKLADGTNTKFNKKNLDIRYEDGGETDYSNFRTSVIGLFNDGKILILQRGSTANWMPNKWSIVGGVVDEGENPKEAIIRECFEEVGLKPINVSFDYNLMTNDSGEIYYYHGDLESDNVQLDYENSNYAFISKSEIDDYDFVPHVKEFIIKLFAKI